MKKFRSFGFLLLILLLIMPFDMMAQETSSQETKKEEGNSKSVISYLNLYGGGGYSAMFHGIEGTNVPGGGAGMIGFGYLMKHKSNFNFNAGVEFMFLNSKTKIDPMGYTADYIYSDNVLKDHNVKYNLNFYDYSEQHNRFSLNIPIMFGGQFSSLYFLLGAKIGVPIMGNFSAKSIYTTFIEDDMLIDNLEDIYTHGLGTYNAVGKDKLKFGLDVTASAELGVCIDEWMPESMKTLGVGEKSSNLSYRLGLFVDYGFLNINANETSGILIHTPGTKVQGDKVVMPENEIGQIAHRSVFNSNLAESKMVNPFVVGAKFTVLFQMDKAPKEKPQPKPKPRRNMKLASILRDIQYEEIPTFFYCYISDLETDSILAANVRVFNIEGKTDTIFASTASADKGFVEQQIDDGQYGIKVTHPGYIDYVDTLYAITSDTLYIGLQPIKEDVVIILRNLLFDTNKTKIRNISTPSLEELYQLLVTNANMRIRITGHTDNVGTERYNKRLSEGRAKAVYDEMIKRGIDASRMEWEGKGSTEPIESNDTEEGRAENRRVEFTILSK